MKVSSQVFLMYRVCENPILIQKGSWTGSDHKGSYSVIPLIHTKQRLLLSHQLRILILSWRSPLVVVAVVESSTATPPESHTPPSLTLSTSLSHSQPETFTSFQPRSSRLAREGWTTRVEGDPPRHKTKKSHRRRGFKMSSMTLTMGTSCRSFPGTNRTSGKARSGMLSDSSYNICGLSVLFSRYDVQTPLFPLLTFRVFAF